MSRFVTPEDLQPAGWVCEACGHPFKVNDEAFGTITAVTDSTPRDLEVLLTPEQRDDERDAGGYDDPIPILGDYRCRSCWDTDAPIEGIN